MVAERHSFLEQRLLLFYGLMMGLIVGAWGNLWASAFFEYYAKGEHSPTMTNWVWASSLILIIMIAIFLVLTCVFYRRWQKHKSEWHGNGVNTAKIELSKPVDYDGLIGDLIKKIDNEKSFLKIGDYLRVLSMFLFIIISISILVVLPYGSLVTFSDRLIIVLAGLAFIVSYGLFKRDSIEEDIVDLKYFRAVEKFNISKDDKPFLKVLIKMKAKNKEFTLAEIRKIHPDLFTKEKLLEKLYD
jgi:hypothetical protein